MATNRAPPRPLSTKWRLYRCFVLMIICAVFGVLLVVTFLTFSTTQWQWLSLITDCSPLRASPYIDILTNLRQLEVLEQSLSLDVLLNLSSTSLPQISDFDRTLERLLLRPLNASFNFSLPSRTDGPGYMAKYGDIPLLLHQTAPSFDFPVDRRVVSWKGLNPTLSYRFYTDAEVDRYVRERFQAPVYALFKALPLMVMRADLFRYLVLYADGGIYADVDTTCLRPIHEWADSHKGVRLIVGIENNFMPAGWLRTLQLCQWTIAAAPRHPALGATIVRVLRRSRSLLGHLPHVKRDERPDVVMEITGPAVFTDGVLEHLEERYGATKYDLRDLSVGRLVGDVYVLPLTGFQPGNKSQKGSKPVSDPQAKVWHAFEGSWRNLG